MISLVLATLGRGAELDPLLDSLCRQAPGSFELIVVDQNPDDRVLERLGPVRERAARVEHLRMGLANLAAARNQGLSVARGEWVAFPDDDCWYAPDCLARIAEAAAQNPEADGLIAHWPQAQPAAPEAGRAITHERLRRFREVDTSSITLFLRRSAVRAAGGFDQRFGVGQYYGAGEETDLLLRLLAQGRRIVCAPSAVVHHAAPGAPAALTLPAWRAARARARGVGGLYAKHRLDPRIIARGLVAPLPRALVSRRPLPAAALALAEVVGRLQGWLRWRFVRR